MPGLICFQPLECILGRAIIGAQPESHTVLVNRLLLPSQNFVDSSKPIMRFGMCRKIIARWSFCKIILQFLLSLGKITSHHDPRDCASSTFQYSGAASAGLLRSLQ